MSLPDELTSFGGEIDFTDKFLIPLLNRLGFTIVVNFHGKREFGKDLIFGEIDRFSHIRYHGLQSKYLPSIGKKAVHELIQDCDESFAKDFKHPQTGHKHKISTFYAVNAGTFSDEARDLFFASLSSKHADNIRLIDGKGLLALDRSAAINQTETGRESLIGLLIEASYNEEILQRIIPSLNGIIKGDGHNVQYPSLRLRVNAVASYLLKPFLVGDMPVEVVEKFWSMGTAFNRALDEAGSSPLHTVVSIKVPAAKAFKLIPQLVEETKVLKQSVRKVLAKLGPLASM